MIASSLFKIQLSFLFFFAAKTIEIDALRFQDKDLNVIGTLEYGQFGVVCLSKYFISLCFEDNIFRSRWSVVISITVFIFVNLWRSDLP